MTLDTDDLTQRLNDQVADVNGSPDLDDLHSRVEGAHRRRRRITGGVTAALVLALAGGSVVWATSGDDAPARVSVADAAPDGLSPAPTAGPVSRETPFGKLTVEVVPTESHPIDLNPVTNSCADGPVLKLGLESPDGSNSLFQHAVSWGMSANQSTGKLHLGLIALSAGEGGPSLTTMVEAPAGRYRATFADGTTDETSSVNGVVVIVGPSTLDQVGGALDGTYVPGPGLALPDLTLERLAEDGTVAESWSHADLVATATAIPPGGAAVGAPTAGGTCVTFDASAPNN